MGSSQDLAGKLDFDIGLEFQEEIRRCLHSPVHHPSPTPNGSFFLLVTFRRFLFRLTEESVSLALQSCLGGRALDFHVKFLSNNHFRFSVFSKEVGFRIYKLRRVISSQFDCYFHLWNNGTPHWEREKRAWEIEQEKEWTKVLSRSAKREAKKVEQKHVRFATKIVQSPKAKASPKLFLKFGSFTTEVDPGSCSMPSFCTSPAPSPPPEPGRDVLISSSHASDHNGHTSTPPPNAGATANVAIQLSNYMGRRFSCSRCLGLDHTRRGCLSRIRCLRCLRSGHVMRFCKGNPKTNWQWRPKSLVTKSEPVLQWRPKLPIQKSNDPNYKFEETGIAKESEQNHPLPSSTLPPSPNTSTIPSSSDASSVPIEDRARYIATLQHCATITLFHRKGIPNYSLPARIISNAREALLIKPIMIDSQLILNQNAAPTPTSLEIVPWRPCPHAVALRFLPFYLEAKRRAVLDERAQITQEANQNEVTEASAEVVNHQDELELQMGDNEGPLQTDPENVDFQASPIQPSPTPTRGRKRRAARASSTVSLPIMAASPLVEGSVRRSIRLNKIDGYCPVRLSKDPNRKKNKICVVMIDEKTGKTGPVPIPVLQGWGIDCGVTPGELSEDALLQAPEDNGSNNAST